MKKRYSFSILAIAIIILIASCKKDPVTNTSEKVGISKVTHFPILTMVGEQMILVPNGGTFTDPGVTAKAGSTEVPVTAAGNLNTSQDGVYVITYSAKNSDGFSATTYRTIVVYSADASSEAHDLSGSYLRSATGQLTIWKKIAPGTYLVTNPGGAASGGNLSIIVLNPTGYIIHAPSQPASDGSISGTQNETFTPGSPDKYTWVFINPTYGTSLRSFVKQ
ncbi:MAG: immunoglobulin-like domain-containing protein [Ginsengibacter sp.]